MKLRDLFEQPALTDIGLKRNTSLAHSRAGRISFPDIGRPSSGAPTRTLGDPQAPVTGANELPSVTGTGGEGRVIPNRSTNPLFTLNGQQSSRTVAGAGNEMMNRTLPMARRMAGLMGIPIIINDAIAKGGSSRETETQGSQHFQGRALDISTANLNDQQKLQLVQAALRVGFTGFGFGNTILHVDTGPRRHWAYGNSSYGGVAISQLGGIVRSYSPGGTATA